MENILNIEQFIVALILACITAYFVYRNQVKSRQAIASANFRHILNADVVFDIDTLGVVFNTHQEAIRIFKPYIYSFKRRSFSQKWKDYDDWANEILRDSKGKSSSTYKIELGLQKRNIQAEFRNHIEALLKFAGNI